MVGTQAAHTQLLDEFVAWQQTQPERWEFFQGIAYAMAGAGNAHVTASLNVGAALKSRLRGSGCRVYGPDVNLRIDAADALFHPDVTVSCAVADHAANDAIREPVLIVEVLSDSTATYDRGRKFAAYRGLPSLREYMQVDVEAATVEVYRLGADGHWVLFDFAGAPSVELASVAASVPMAEVFEDIDQARP